MTQWRHTPRGKWWIKCYYAAYRANAIARELGAEGYLTQEDVNEVLSGADCFYCGVTQPEPQQGAGPRWDCFGIDHQVSMLNGGTNWPDNIVASCQSCNSSKGTNGTGVEFWAQRFDCCVICGTTEKPHEARGMCMTCYSREYDRANPKRHDHYKTQGKRIKVD